MIKAGDKVPTTLFANCGHGRDGWLIRAIRTMGYGPVVASGEQAAAAGHRKGLHL